MGAFSSGRHLLEAGAIIYPCFRVGAYSRGRLSKGGLIEVLRYRPLCVKRTPKTHLIWY